MSGVKSDCRIAPNNNIVIAINPKARITTSLLSSDLDCHTAFTSFFRNFSINLSKFKKMKSSNFFDFFKNLAEREGFEPSVGLYKPTTV
jgi:hypothetical protein